MGKIYEHILKNKQAGKKQFAILVDPDKLSIEQAGALADHATSSGADFLFVGGSLLTNGSLHLCIESMKKYSKLPVILFPGNTLQIDQNADAILFLSLISGRNPDLLIGKHVISAPLIREKNLEAIATGYMLIESGNATAVLYMSNTLPIPADKPDIAGSTALAGEMLGLKMIFMDAGSGAQNPINEKMIRSVRDNITIPLVIGGGISTPEKAILNCKAGADIIVIGNSIEKDHSLVKRMADAIHSVN
jgi:phosphoglycerol geranylgeranyltransferase